MSLVIPTVDLADIDSGDATRRERATAALREAFGIYGLAYVKGHSVDFEATLRFYDSFRTFVERPLADKQRFARADLWFQRGWTPPNTEVAVASGGQPDFKECYFVAPYEAEAELQLQYPELYPPNVLTDDPLFAEGAISLGRALHEAGEKLLEGCADALDVPKHTFLDAVNGGAHVTRVLNYLPLDEAQIAAKALWGEEHTDFNLLTLLPGGQFYDPAGAPARKPNDKSGLFLRTRPTAEHPQGIQVPGRAPEGCIVVQVGQQLEILTGGEFVATPHVITAPGLTGWSRLASAHFMHAQANQRLYPLEKFRTPESMRAYGPPVLAGTYSIKTLVDIGLAPKSALEKLGYRHYDRLESMRATEESSG